MCSSLRRTRQPCDATFLIWQPDLDDPELLQLLQLSMPEGKLLPVPVPGASNRELNSHISLLASLAPVVEEKIHPDGTRQVERRDHTRSVHTLSYPQR